MPTEFVPFAAGGEAQIDPDRIRLENLLVGNTVAMTEQQREDLGHRCLALAQEPAPPVTIGLDGGACVSWRIGDQVALVLVAPPEPPVVVTPTPAEAGLVAVALGQEA